jgi:ABC-type multidrug transport system fused ATPase/permease subunit
VIDKGIVAESGTHDELIKHNGLYKKLNELQFEFHSIS